MKIEEKLEKNTVQYSEGQIKMLHVILDESNRFFFILQQYISKERESCTMFLFLFLFSIKSNT